VSFTYLCINLGIILGPLCLTPNHRVAYYRKLPAVAVATLVVGGLYIAWDIVVTEWGEWSFNPRYLTGIKVVNLPLEEILFFVTVPYSCLFIFEALSATAKDKKFRLSVGLVLTAVGVLATGSILYFNQGYTSKALASCALFLLLALRLDRPLLAGRRYWIWIAICLIPFLIVNTILTALPVVQYNPTAIWGPRFITIPFEDFFYNFSLLSFYLLVYRMAGRKLNTARR
jgi:lycopene cyclase domain-containing protein